MTAYPWREPDAETEDYPGLVVHDGRVSGSITVGHSRLPLWAISYSAIHCGWEEVEAGWSPTEHYGFTQDDFSAFIGNLLEMRGEFGRLLLVLADAERLEGERSEEVMAPHGSLVRMSVEPGDGFVEWPPSWWEQDDLRKRVADQLQRCLDALS